MRRYELPIFLIVISAAIAGCARSSLYMAPERADRPWIPAVTAGGEIVPGEAGSTQPSINGYVLPSNPALGMIPPPPSGLVAQHPYSLPELIDIAQSANPLTRIAWDDARNAALAAGVARSIYLPNLSAAIVGGYRNSRSRNSLLDTKSEDDLTAKGTISLLSLQWLLFDFGQRSAVLDAAKQNSVITNIAFTAAHQEMIYKVSLAFYANAAARAHVTTAAKALSNAKEVQTAAEDRYSHGVGTVIEVAEAKQATAQAKFVQIQAIGVEQNTYLSLLAAMGVSPLTKIAIADISNRKLSGAMTGSITEFVTAALARRPDTLTAYAAHEASLANLRAARAEFLPKLFVAATGSYTTGGLDVTGVPGAAQQQSTYNLSPRGLGATVLLGVTIPLYDGGRRDAVLEQARANADKSAAAMTEIRNEAIREIVEAGNAAKTGIAAYDAAEALASATRTTFDAALQSYRHGVGSITAVTNAETQMLLAENSATDAYNDALSAAATLALSAGTLGAAPQ